MDAFSRLKLAVLAALAQAGGPAHAAALRPEVEARLGKPVNRGALARALSELRRATLVLDRHGDPAPHGGPPRIFYQLSDAGRKTLMREIRAFARLTRLSELSPAVRAFLQDPPPGSSVAAARDYGIDLNRLARALIQSPQERYREAIAAMRAFERYAKR